MFASELVEDGLSFFLPELKPDSLIIKYYEKLHLPSEQHEILKINKLYINFIKYNN